MYDDLNSNQPLDGRGQAPLRWLRAVLLAGLAAVALSWFTGFLNPLLPSPQKAVLAIKNFRAWAPEYPDEVFRVVLTWLEGDDSGADTTNVARAFTSIGGIALISSARTVSAPGARDEWHPSMQRQARAELDYWNADLAIVGVVKKPGEVLNLWFVPRLGSGTLSRGDHPYVLEDVTLGSDFHLDFRAQLTATALAAVAPLADSEVRGHIIDTELPLAAERLTQLLDAGSIGHPQHAAALRLALGNALWALGEREAGTEYLQEAVRAYRAALPHYTRAHAPRKWATTQINLGSTLATLGDRRAQGDHLEQAIDAFNAALTVVTQEQAPLVWATVQNNLGGALVTLAYREADTALIHQGMSAFHAALLGALS